MDFGFWKAIEFRLQFYSEKNVKKTQTHPLKNEL